MPVAFPAGLPTVPINATPMAGDQDDVNRLQPERGPVKTRLRYTGTVQDKAWDFVYTPAQLAVFLDWYRDDLGKGVLSFDFVDPEEGGTAEFIFASAPQRVQQTKGAWRVTWQVQRLP